MAENLEALRKQRNMKVGQLAAKSGIPTKQIVAYEKGERIKVADMPKLARALFVDVSDINWISEKPQPPSPQKTISQQESKPAQQLKQTPASKPARPSQIQHLLRLAQKLGEDEAAVTNKAGKPLADLSLAEASALLLTYNKAWLTYKASRPPGDPHTSGTQGKRATTPEAVDHFEMAYLHARQEAGDALTFTLFDGSVWHGRILGFSPYTITIQQTEGPETTLQKLAIAYYSVYKEG